MLLAEDMLISSSLHNDIKTFLENLGSIEVLITIIGTLGAGLIVILKYWERFYSLVASDKIEIALMTRREQNKYMMASNIYILGLICLMNCIWLLYKPKDWDLILYGVMGIVAIPIGLGAAILLFVLWMYKKLKNIHLFRAIGIIIKTCLRKIGLLVVGILLWVYNKCKRMLCRGIVGKAIMWIRNKLKSISDIIYGIWKKSEKEKNISTTIDKRNILRLTIFISSLISGVALNCCAAYSESELQDRIVLCIFTVWLVYKVFSVYTHEGLSIEKARIYYYDIEKNRKIYIYYKHDDYYCVCGDTEKEIESENKYLIPYKELEKNTLLTVRNRDSK